MNCHCQKHKFIYFDLIAEYERASCSVFSVATMAPSLLGPFFMSQISFFRLVSLNVSNKGLEKKFNIAISVLFTTIIGYGLGCVSHRMIGDESEEHYSIGPIHQVSL